MSKTRDNHYVPQWYQRGFLLGHSNKLYYLDLAPDSKQLSDGRVITMNDRSLRSTSQCFYQTDLYTTFFGEYINDEIERRLFGKIDDIGVKAVRAFIGEDISGWHHHFSNFFSYMDSQKIRTPKGLDWIRKHYPHLSQVDLMMEMQAIRNLHCTIWTEGVREIVSAKNSDVKFILTDHPVTVYNYYFPPECGQCSYPNDPSIALKGTQTIFPLDLNHCLILTNIEYAKNPDSQDPTEKRTHARFVRDSMVRTDAFIRSRFLSESDVVKINLILKERARRYIAAPNKDWLFPEKILSIDWRTLGQTLLPQSELYRFGGELFAKFEDGRTYYQDAFGRTTPENKYLKKEIRKNKIGRNDICGCGSGKKYKKCCLNKNENQRPSWETMSIRERNIILYNGIRKILGLDKGKAWDDVRRELNNNHVKKIHELYGSLWPNYTDISSLLPKPDKELRALYTGIIDPRVISMFALSFTPYFDEILIQQPFINPGNTRPEFSPVHSPHQYKQQTLKNIMLLELLMPFIDAGFVNFIPDPCSFDQHLHLQMLEMAKIRSKKPKIDGKKSELFKILQKEEFMRTLCMFPKEQQKHMIVRAMPELLAEQIQQLVEFIERQNKKDPFTLLQDDVFGTDGGQLMIMNLAPNFEISFYIAQATGSILLTDSPYRWEEIKGAQHKKNGNLLYPWHDLSVTVNGLDFIVNANPEISFHQRLNKNFESIKNVFKELFLAVLDNESKPEAKHIEKLKKELLVSHEKSRNNLDDKKDLSIKAKMECLIPEGGFIHNNVQRLLLTSGIENHLKYLPMAIFMKQA